jgi:hypothetical protein
MHARSPLHPIALALAAAALTACAGMPGRPMAPHDQPALPEAPRVPTGHRVAMETVGVGELTYECRDRAQGVGQEWVFVAPAGCGNIPLQRV